MDNADIWIYREHLESPKDIAGYDVIATDGSIGSIDSATTDASRRFVIVDTGLWIFGKRRLIPAGTINEIDHDQRTVSVAMTKAQIKDAPDYEPSEDDSYFDRIGTYYGPYGF